MNHLELSIAKSLTRMFGCVWAIWFSVDLEEAVIILAVYFGLAEILGVLEEIFDKRKE